MSNCLLCNKETKNPKFCSRSHSATYNNTQRFYIIGKSRKYCLFCNKEFHSFSSTKQKFCSTSCFQKYGTKKIIDDWLNEKISGGSSVDPQELKKPIRTYLIEQSNYKCCICNWSEINPFTNKYPLEIDHIDGNTLNHRPENLRVLCPNCHSLTMFHGILNKGRGRRKFRELYREGK
jgi:hypothetical protein